MVSYHTGIQKAATGLPIRSIVNDPPETPHRVDVYTVARKHELDALSPLSRREQTVKSCAESMANDFGVDHNESTVEKISNFESPEKWTIYNGRIAESLALNRGVQYNLSRLALRVLLDAFLYKLGYRAIEWTEEETMQWEQRKQAAGLSRGQTIKKSKNYLMQSGFTESELSALFSANNRTQMNSAAHEIEINTMVASLKCLDMAETSRSAVEKAFEFVCGVNMKDVDPNSKDLVTSTGIMSRPMRDQWLFDEEVGSWD
jgi:hypothetical protein